MAMLRPWTVAPQPGEPPNIPDPAAGSAAAATVWDPEGSYCRACTHSCGGKTLAAPGVFHSFLCLGT